MPLLPGTVLNKRYRILSILGQGGMGSVYHALDENLGVAVAVKENLFLTDEYARQFQREASILANLRHPNLPRVSDYFIIPGQGQYLIMEYIEGEDLRERIERNATLPETEVALIGAAICDALTYLHNRRPQIIHRDIKPGNIKITPEGTVILVDFGLAKVVQFGQQQTSSGARAMTPGYSPPEQYGTAPTDARSDIYSLGATLFAALTSAIPEDALARATGRAQLTSLRDLSPKTSRKLASVVEKALEVEPEDRYQTADEMKKALLAAVNFSRSPDEKIIVSPPPAALPGQTGYNSQPLDLPNGGRRPEPAPPASRPRRRRRRAWSMVLPLAVIIALAVLFFGRPNQFWLPAAAFRSPTATGAVAEPLPSSTATLPAPTLPATQETLATVAAVIEDATPTPTQTATLAPTPSPTQTGGGQSELAFASDRSGSMQIWIMNADGSNQRQLTSLTDGACQPAWAPDGQLLAFISPCAVKHELYDGAKIYTWDLQAASEPQALPLPASPAGDFYPTFSPDGKWIAFTTLRGPRPQIMLYNREDGSLQQVTDGTRTDLQPAFSPDSQQIAFIRKFQYTLVWLAGLRGENAVQFSPNSTLNNYQPVWTPDGAFVLVSQSSGSGPFLPWLVALRSVGRQASEELRLPQRGQPDIAPVADPAISPDGAWIAYESWPDGTNHDIYLVTINGANRTRLTEDKSFDFGPAWRP